jgi:putative SOS response-associated peptidase YedK
LEEISIMCGRLVISEPDLSVFVEPFNVQQVEPAEWQPHFNIAPTQLAPLITNEPERHLSLARFGLIPYWADDPRIANRLINARSESVARSKVFKPALQARRGIIPASGYFEWRATAQGKQPVFIHDPRGQALALAALWEQWRDPNGELIRSFAVITRSSEGLLKDIHDRMPCVLRPDDIEPWLDSEAPPLPQLASILQAAGNVDHLALRWVSALANSPRNDGPECIAEAPEPAAQRESAAERQLALFEGIEAAPRRRRARTTR